MTMKKGLHLNPCQTPSQIFLATQIKNIFDEAQIDPEVYNGKGKLKIQDELFVSKNEIITAVKSLKTKTVRAMIGCPKEYLLVVLML